MADLIDRYKLLCAYCTDCNSGEKKPCPIPGRCHEFNLIKNAPTVNRWIPVEDALPEIKEFNISNTVLCYCDSGALAIARLEANGFGQVGFNCEKDDDYHHAAGKVLYWMPIPEIPEQPMEVENENR